jgi:zinc transport system substrate-binding protein
MAELATKVRKDRVTTIFYETLVSPKVARTLARETGATAAALDPIEGLTKDERAAGKDYSGIMRDNLSALRVALGCH